MEPLAANPHCWKETGTFGDRSCPELLLLSHCRNCPVYAAAGRRLLDREAPEGYREEWTSLLANREVDRAVADLSVIVFRLREEFLALKTVLFQEMAQAASPHSIPLRSGEVFKGIVNVNGELVLCVDLASLLGITGSADANSTGASYPRLVVVCRDGQRFVFPADEVCGLQRFALAAVQELPATLSRSMMALTTGIFPWQGKTVGLLEEEKLFAALSRSLAP